MQAQAITTRRTIRMPRLSLLVAALLVAAIALGAAIVTARDEAPTGAVPTAQVAYAHGPSVRFGAIGSTVTAASAPHAANRVPKTATGSVDVKASAPSDENQGFGSAIGKRLP
jgi:hypothetical protein